MQQPGTTEPAKFVRCVKCSALSHVNVATGLGDRPRCLSCGHEAVPVDLAAERRAKAGAI